MPAPHRPHFAPPDNYSGPRRSLVLAGGGMRVAWQAGALLALAEEGLSFAHADGASGGTMNLSMLLSGIDPAGMCDRWRSLRVADFASFLPLADYLSSPHLMALGDARGITGKVYPHLGIDVERIHAAVGMAGTYNVCNFSRKVNLAIAHTEIDLDLLVAAISLPIYMPPVKRGEFYYTDSVWIKDANLTEAVRRGAEEIWLLWCIGNTPEYKPGFFRQYVHMIEMSANGALFEEFDRIRELNGRIERGDSPYGQRGPVRLHVIKPEYALPLDPDFYLGKIDAATLIANGYASAKRYLSQRIETGIALTPEATAMNESTCGISFREKMEGGFSLGSTDPAEGERQGRAAGTVLTMHATINIDDMERFTQEATHPGRLTGTLDFAPFGQGIPAKAGVFNLFSPGGQPGLKLMVYEMAFEHGGQDYYLAGRKEVRDDPGLDLWKDTTTLYTLLHRGTDASGPVVGAGILSLGVGDLLQMLTTMQATGPDSLTGKATALGKFGEFFLGNLWTTYGKKASA